MRETERGEVQPQPDVPGVLAKHALIQNVHFSNEGVAHRVGQSRAAAGSRALRRGAEEAFV